MPEQPDNIVPITQGARTAAEKFGAEHDRELLTILFTDLVDSTKLQSDLGNVEAARLAEIHRTIVRDELAPYDAREIEWAGDSCLAVFTKPSDAIVFALKTQSAHREARRDEPKLPRVRIGMHLGEIVIRHHQDGGKRTEDLFGVQVSEASRVMSLARGNQIYCTRAVFDNARGSLKGRAIDGVDTIQWLRHGFFELKGSAEPAEVFEVGEEGLAPLTPPESNDKCWPAVLDGAGKLIPAADRDPARQGLGRGMTFAGLALSFVLGAIGAWFVVQSLAPPDAPQVSHVARFPVALPRVQGALIEGAIDVSKDGRILIYLGRDGNSRRIFYRDLEQIRSKPLPGTENAGSISLSPDGQWIAYAADGTLKKVSITGGRPIDLMELQMDFGTSWASNATLYFGAGLRQSFSRVQSTTFHTHGPPRATRFCTHLQARSSARTSGT